MTVEYLDQPPAGWFPLDVMKAGDNRKWDWCALIVDLHPDELKHCQCKTAFLYVHPDDYRPDGKRTAREAWVRVPGKHRNKDAAIEGPAPQAGMFDMRTKAARHPAGRVVCFV